MSSPQRHVLVVGADQSKLDRVAPMLRRAEFDVHTVADSSYVLDLVQGTAFELLVVAYPPEELSVNQILSSVRAEGSLSRTAGLLLLANADDLDRAHRYVERGANRAVSVDWAESRLWQVVGDLVNVAPRVFLRALVDIDVSAELETTTDVCRTENVSASGMLLHGASPRPHGTAFDFVFSLPGEAGVIEGQAEIVRQCDPDREGVEGFGARFVSFTGDGGERMVEFIRSQLSRD